MAPERQHVGSLPLTTVSWTVVVSFFDLFFLPSFFHFMIFVFHHYCSLFFLANLAFLTLISAVVKS